MNLIISGLISYLFVWKIDRKQLTLAGRWCITLYCTTNFFKHGQSIFDQTCLVCDKKQVFSCFICCVDIQDYFEWHMMINLQKNAVLNEKPLLQLKYVKRWLKLKSITHCVLPPMHDATTLLQTPAWSRLFNPGQRQPLTAARLTVAQWSRTELFCLVPDGKAHPLFVIWGSRKGAQESPKMTLLWFVWLEEYALPRLPRHLIM